MDEVSCVETAGKQSTFDEGRMKNRAGAVKISREFCDAFNRNAIAVIETMLDEQVVFSQQNVEGSLIGKASVISKFKARFDTMSGGNKETAVPGIVDLSDIKAHPCIVLRRNDVSTALILLDLKINNRIRSITMLTNPDAVAKARIALGPDRSR